MKNAACVATWHNCPVVGAVPHSGGPVVGPGAVNVKIRGLPAARLGDDAACAGAVDTIKRGAPSVFIEGKEAARRGDSTVHGGVIMSGDPTVIIGGNMWTSPADTIEEAMNQIRASDWAQCSPGSNVLDRLEDLKRQGRIEYIVDPKGDQRGCYVADTDNLYVESKYCNSVDSTASELVHEGTHANDSTSSSIDQETRCNQNQLDYYDEQRRSGYNDPDLEDRRNAPSLRDNVRSRYPNLPEHSD